ncbi:MAG: hypothetical protein ABI855_20840 [Bacteroidota bacterium]
MENKLSSFEIVVSDKEWIDGDHIVYKLSYDNMNICNNLRLVSAVSSLYSDKKGKNDSSHVLKTNEFYIGMAIRLSGVHRNKLVEKFGDIKINFKMISEDEKYELNF